MPNIKMTDIKILVLRFSSLGDIAQAMDIPRALKDAYPGAQVHWAVREDFRQILGTHPDIDFIWSLSRKTGVRGLFRLISDLRRQEFTHLYDAHNNLRSHLISFFLKTAHFARRPKNRFKRWLLFRWRISLLPTPFRGRKSFLEPLEKWGISAKPREVHLNLPMGNSKKSYVTLAPSAAWAMKRWPLEHWQTLIQKYPETQFVVLGGAEDTFLESLKENNGQSVSNVTLMAGKLSLLESLQMVAESDALISNDTGLLHYGDLMGVPSVAIIGPTAFGYPSGANSSTAEIQLKCKPCSKDGRGRCRNSVYQRCLKDLSPEHVNDEFKKILKFKRTVPSEARL